ncbi:MAG: hypothetical protein ACLR43_00130 [Faecalibacillus faecis]
MIATFDTVGQYKTDAMKERMLKINPKSTFKHIHVSFTRKCY